MVFDSGSELECRKRRTEIPLTETGVWSLAWINAWPWAKMVAMEVEVYVRQFGQPWADGWIRAEADWARAQTRAQAPAEMWRRAAEGSTAEQDTGGEEGRGRRG